MGACCRPSRRSELVSKQRFPIDIDLYYRLNVFPIPAPPLRERQDVIPLLARHIVRVFAEQMGKVWT